MIESIIEFCNNPKNAIIFFAIGWVIGPIVYYAIRIWMDNK